MESKTIVIDIGSPTGITPLQRFLATLTAHTIVWTYANRLPTGKVAITMFYISAAAATNIYAKMLFSTPGAHKGTVKLEKYIESISSYSIVSINDIEISSGLVSIVFYTDYTSSCVDEVYIGNLTENTVPKATADGLLEDSLITDDGTTVKIGDVDNNTAIESDGTIKFNGTATVWEDLRAPATQLRVNPATSLPHFDYTYIGYLFDKGTTETVYIIMQMPHSWKLGSSIYPHVHWMPVDTGPGDIVWRLEYTWVNVLAIDPGSYTAMTDLVVSTEQIAYKHYQSRFGEIAGTGKTLSSILSIKLSRIGGDGKDSYNNDALLKEFDIHYEMDTIGSREELVK